MTLTPLDETKIIQNVKLDLEITDKFTGRFVKNAVRPSGKTF